MWPDRRLIELLQIEFPIVQAPMGWIARSALASAVSRAGGLGIVTALTQPTPDEVLSLVQAFQIALEPVTPPSAPPAPRAARRWRARCRAAAWPDHR